MSVIRENVSRDTIRRVSLILSDGGVYPQASKATEPDIQLASLGQRHYFEENKN